MKIVDTSKVQKNFRITLVKAVRRKLEDPQVGDRIGFFENSEGDIVLKKL